VPDAMGDCPDAANALNLMAPEVRELLEQKLNA
jgi:hypothetical protein